MKLIALIPLLYILVEGSELKSIDSALNAIKYRTNYRYLAKDPYYFAGIKLSETSKLDLIVYGINGSYDKFSEISIIASNRYASPNLAGEFIHDWGSFKNDLVLHLSNIWALLFKTDLPDTLTNQLLNGSETINNGSPFGHNIKTIKIRHKKGVKWDSIGTDAILINIYFK